LNKEDENIIAPTFGSMVIFGIVFFISLLVFFLGGFINGSTSAFIKIFAPDYALLKMILGLISS
jgi:hypothetical protein